MRFVVLCLSLFLISPAVAQEPSAIAQNAVTAWQAWMKQHGIKAGAMVVYHNGAEITQASIGRSVDEPAKLASLSKAITAVCALKALSQAEKTRDLTLGELLPDLLAKYPPADGRMRDITVGDLITHRSGIQSRYHRKHLEKLRTFSKENKAWQFSKFAAEKLAAKPGAAEYHYSNANYLALGLVIEALVDEAYEPYCTREILAPAGVTSAKLNETWTVMSSWGGWEMSAADYMRFALFYFADGKHFDAGIGVPLPAATVGRGRSYGPGVLYRRSGLGTSVWTNGSWNWNGRINDRFGAYFALYDNGFAVSINYAHDAFKEGAALDEALWKATHPQ